MLAAQDKIQLVSDAQNRGCWNTLRRKLVDSKLAMIATPENVQAVCVIASEFYTIPGTLLVPAILLSQQVDAWPELPGPAVRVFVECACNLFLNLHSSGNQAAAAQQSSSSSSSAENHHLQSIMDQIEYANKDLSNVSRMLVDLLCQHNLAQLAIRPLMKAIKFISSQRPHVLTPMHAHLLTACVSAGHYSVAVTFLRNSPDIRSIDQTGMFLSSYDYLAYFYFAGMVYHGVRRYEDALESLVECITTPAEALSVIMVQALKQAKLISLICRQTPLSLPKYTSAVMLRASKQSLQPYDSIVKSFMDRDAASLGKTIADNYGLLEKDLCCGLAQQVFDALSDHKIRELTRTYKTLSMTEIASKVGLEKNSAEKEVLRLVGGGELRARIDQQQQVAAFLDEEEFLAIFRKGGDDEQDLLRALGDQMPKFVDETMRCGAQLRSLRTQILSSREYLTKMLSRGNASGMAGTGAAAGGGWAMGVESGSGSGAWGGGGGDEDFI